MILVTGNALRAGGLDMPFAMKAQGCPTTDGKNYDF
jgi:hypothetical protein